VQHKELIMGFLDDLFEKAKQRAGCDDATCVRMGGESDSELVRMVRNGSGRDRVGAFAELKRRYGTDGANDIVRRG
jgi:hypothetical protein